MIAKLYTKETFDIEYNNNASIISEDELLEYLICSPITEHRQQYRDCVILSEISHFFYNFFFFFLEFAWYSSFSSSLSRMSTWATKRAWLLCSSSTTTTEQEREREREGGRERKQRIQEKETKCREERKSIAVSHYHHRRSFACFASTSLLNSIFFWQPICVSS